MSAEPTSIADGDPPPQGSLVWPGIITVIAFAILCGLGLWQLQRLEWKQAIIASMQERMTGPAAPLPPDAVWPALASAGNEYRRYTVSGTFDHAKETYIFRASGKGQLGPVYHVITPLKRADGSTVLINRGFVPDNLRDPARRMAGQIAGTVTISGFLRLTETRNMFTPADSPAKRIWYTRDPQAIIHQLKLNRAAPFLLDASEAPNPGGWPKGGVTSVKIPNNHLSYAWTWFGLAGVLLAVFGAFARSRRR